MSYEDVQARYEDDIPGAADASLESEIIVEAGERILKWAKTKVGDYLADEREKKILNGYFGYFLPAYAERRGFAFRPGLVKKILDNHIDKKVDDNQIVFGFLFGDIVKGKHYLNYGMRKGKVVKKVAKHKEYRVSAFLPLDFVKELLEKARDSAKDKEAERLEEVVDSCEAIEQIIGHLPVNGKGKLDEGAVQRGVVGIARVLWYLFFEIKREQIFEFYRNMKKYTSPRPGSDTLKMMKRLLADIKDSDDPDTIEDLEHFQRKVFFGKFLGVYAFSEAMEGKSEKAAGDVISYHLATMMGGLPESGAVMFDLPKKDYLKGEYARFFHLATVVLEKLFREWVDEIKSMKDEYADVADRFNVMKLALKKIGFMHIVTYSKRFNPMFVVFSSNKSRRNIRERCIAYVDSREEDAEDFKLERLPYHGEVVPTAEELRKRFIGR